MRTALSRTLWMVLALFTAILQYENCLTQFQNAFHQAQVIYNQCTGY